MSNLQQRIAFVYGPLTKIWTAMEAEKESYIADEGETNPLFEMSKLFDQVILLLGQAMNSCSYIMCFNFLYWRQEKSSVYAERQCYSILGCRECYLDLSMRNWWQSP